MSWLEKKTGPPAKDIDSVETAKAFIEDNDVAVIGFFKVGSVRGQVLLPTLNCHLPLKNEKKMDLVFLCYCC